MNIFYILLKGTCSKKLRSGAKRNGAILTTKAKIAHCPPHRTGAEGNGL